MLRRAVFLALILTMGCSNGSSSSDSGAALDSGIEVMESETVVSLVDVADGNGLDTGPEALVFPEVQAPDLEPACQPGEGCLGDKCEENNQCQSGWCVPHLGDGVCTVLCQDECPDGWSCKLVAGTDPDAVYICVSEFANLCRPCHGSADCNSPGLESACVSYPGGTGFCGAACVEEAESDACPWGFSCHTVETIEGSGLNQCIADAGECPCASASVKGGLSTACLVENEFGVCEGLRACMEEGLTDCDAATPEAEACNGIDDDCDGDVDEPEEVGGDYINLCNDENECTTDTCTGTDGCEYETLDEGECKDGDACTVGDHCEQGQCVGLPIACDDDNPCTDDSCDGLGGCQNLANALPCDDGDPCTVKDSCEDKACNGFTIDCDCQSNDDCLTYEDGNLCNGTLFCNQEKLPWSCQVAPDTAVTCPLPEGAGAICLAAACNPEDGECSFVSANEGFACDDLDACTVGDKCVEGTCTPGVLANCNDGNPCTDDECAPETGCVHADNVSPCSDGDVCTVLDQCAEGECFPGEPLICDDGNVCTDDSCDQQVGCLHIPNLVDCNDGNKCTFADHCKDGICRFGGQVDCNDSNPCTDDVCNNQGGCLSVANSLPCDDGNLCTKFDQCGQTQCQPGDDLVCNDGNLCTDDSCAPDLGCVFQPNESNCDDGNLCTEEDHCLDGMCQGKVPKQCADDNLCTDDSCDPELGCIHTLNDSPCDDDNLCTLGDICADGQCASGEKMECNDGNVCTVDACWPQAGCSFQQLNDFVEVGGCAGACTGCNNGQCVAVADDQEDTEGLATCGDDSGTCFRCFDGQCAFQTDAQDLWNECDTADAPGAGSCRSQQCSGSGFECGFVAGGEAGQPACWRCPGDSFDPSFIADNEQDDEGVARCDDVCQACQGSQCANADVGTDPGDQCPEGAEEQEGGAPNFCQQRLRDGKCDGDGGCNDFGDFKAINQGQQCLATPFCVGDVYYATALCNNGQCNQGSGELGCCGDGACPADKHCDLDSHQCVANYPACQGWEYDGSCWYYDNSDSYEFTCDELCQGHGAECLVAGRIKEASNPNCTVCKHWFPSMSCNFGIHDEPAKPCTYGSSKCEYANYSPAVSSCGGPKYGTATHRFCSCTF